MQQSWLLLPDIKPAPTLLSTSILKHLLLSKIEGRVFILVGMFSASLLKKKKKRSLFHAGE